MEIKRLLTLTEEEIAIERDVVSKNEVQKPILTKLASKTNGDDNESAEDDDPRYY